MELYILHIRYAYVKLNYITYLHHKVNETIRWTKMNNIALGHDFSHRIHLRLADFNEISKMDFCLMCICFSSFHCMPLNDHNVIYIIQQRHFCIFLEHVYYIKSGVTLRCFFHVFMPLFLHTLSLWMIEHWAVRLYATVDITKMHVSHTG